KDKYLQLKYQSQPYLEDRFYQLLDNSKVLSNTTILFMQRIFSKVEEKITSLIDNFDDYRSNNKKYNNIQDLNASKTKKYTIKCNKTNLPQIDELSDEDKYSKDGFQDYSSKKYKKTSLPQIDELSDEDEYSKDGFQDYIDPKLDTAPNQIDIVNLIQSNNNLPNNYFQTEFDTAKIDVNQLNNKKTFAQLNEELSQGLLFIINKRKKMQKEIKDVIVELSKNKFNKQKCNSDNNKDFDQCKDDDYYSCSSGSNKDFDLYSEKEDYCSCTSGDEPSLFQ
ncbi:MAG: hypothetical protein U1E31_03265, partial [Rickettsiales bacterium]